MDLVLINLFTIIIISFTICILTRNELYKILPIVTISIPIVILFIAYFVNLYVAVFVIYILSLLLIFFMLVNNYNKLYTIRDFLKENYFCLLIFIAFSLYFIYVNYNRPAWSWDEFSHWARVVKNMNFTKHLNRAADTYLLFNHYPPNVSLFLYFFNYTKNFIEWRLQYAQSLYTFILVFPIAFYVDKGKNNIKKILIIFLSLLIPMSIYQMSYISLYVDTIMGLLLGYSILIYLFEENKIIKFIGITLSLMAVTLTKDAGAILALLFIVIIFINELLKRIQNKHIKEKINNIYNYKYILYNFLFVLVAYYSYKIYLNSVGIEKRPYLSIYSGGGEPIR